MQRTEEYEFRKDVYNVLIRTTHYRVSGFLAGERILCGNDEVFFSQLLDASDEVLGKAFRKGKMIAVRTEPFLNDYKKVIADDGAYAVFSHQDELSPLGPDFVQSMSGVDTRFTNSFNRYWRDRCARSVKILYYRTLTMDSSAPKYDGIGADASRLMYEKIVAFMSQVDALLSQDITDEPRSEEDAVIVEAVPQDLPTVEDELPVAPEPEEEVVPAPESTIEEDVCEPEPDNTPEPEISVEPNPDSLPFFDYVYTNIACKEYPASGVLLGVPRSLMSEQEFFETLLLLDADKAKKLMGIGEVSAKEVVRLSDMMRRIVSHPGAKACYDNGTKAQMVAPLIERHLSTQHIRVYHSYQKFMESCEGSILNFYLKVIGYTHSTVKFPGLNPNKSQELLKVFTSFLTKIDEYIAGEDGKPDFLYNPELNKLKLTEEQLDKIVSVYQKGKHFPMFTAIAAMQSKLDKRDQDIAARSLNLYYNREVEDLNDIAKGVNLSKERVRQLRENSLDALLGMPRLIHRSGLVGDYEYSTQSEYDFRNIREEEEVDYSNEFLTVCIAYSNPALTIIGDVRKSLLKTADSSQRLYLVPKDLNKTFDFGKFIAAIEDMLREKRFSEYRDDLDIFVRALIKKYVSDEEFYAILKECRQIMLKGYPNNIINSQIYFPANARKSIPYLIEDILREFNRPMTAEEICNTLNERYPDLEQVPAKVGANALRNSNIVAVSRSSTYALAEWDSTEKRGGTIRDIAEEYLNSLIKPIAPLSDICDYIAKFRSNVKESSVKSNLWAESNSRFSVYNKGNVLYIGLSGYEYGDEYKLQEKRQGRRPFKDSLERLEQFIKDNGRFPYSSGVEGEEARLNRFYSVSKANLKNGTLSPEEAAEIERINATYGTLKQKKERISWDERLERFVKYITDNESLPYPSSKEYAWYEENKAAYDAGTLDPTHVQSFAFLVKIIQRMNLS